MTESLAGGISVILLYHRSYICSILVKSLRSSYHPERTNPSVTSGVGPMGRGKVLVAGTVKSS